MIIYLGLLLQILYNTNVYIFRIAGTNIIKYKCLYI